MFKVTNTVPRPFRHYFRAKVNFKGYATYKRFNNQPSFNITNFFNNRYAVASLFGLVGFYYYNQDSAPYTHRRRFLWVPYWLESRIGDMSYRQILFQYQRYVVPSNDPIYREIGSIVDKLLATALETSTNQQQTNHLKNLQWKIHVVNAPNTPPNAFILPNGKIFIFSSILPICKDTDGIATVLSHELSHQLAHHSMEQLSKQPIYIAISSIMYMATGISWFSDLLVGGLLQMPASREMESEADRIGCELMARSCFNLHKIPNFWQRMNQYEQSIQGKRTPILEEFLSTHPNTTKRIHDINSWLPELETIRESSNCHQFNQFKAFF